MLEQIIELDNKKLIEQPINLPDHPYLASLKDFGMDELYAGGVDVGSTTLVAFLANESWRNQVLPFVGPVVEKGIFFVRHMYDANKIYKTTPKNIRQPYSFYLKNGLKAGSENLLKDIFFHDPIYIGLMYAGLNFASETPPFLLSMTSYITGVLAVAGIDVLKGRMAYSHQIKNLKQIGFQREKYYESRFTVLAEEHPNNLLEMFQKEFGLGQPITNDYSDTYFQHNISPHNGRTAKVRFRSRTSRENPSSNDGEESMLNTAQVVFTRAREEKTGIEQSRFFPSEKDKMYFILPQKKETIDSIDDVLLKKYFNSVKAPSPFYTNINFSRTMCNDKELLICADTVHADRPYFVAEIKVRNDLKLLQQAMRFMMVNCPVVTIQTTHGKSDYFVSRSA